MKCPGCYCCGCDSKALESDFNEPFCAVESDTSASVENQDFATGAATSASRSRCSRLTALIQQSHLVAQPTRQNLSVSQQPLRLLSDKTHILFDEAWQAAVQEIFPELSRPICRADVQCASFED